MSVPVLAQDSPRFADTYTWQLAVILAALAIVLGWRWFRKLDLRFALLAILGLFVGLSALILAYHVGLLVGAHRFGGS
jgi:hypothetical protein